MHLFILPAKFNSKKARTRFYTDAVHHCYEMHSLYN